ncbi:MAG: PAS domain-containing sensor histidine kinase [Desulfocapsa sp.]|nr:PAS domain-containing sensor histidine kinase [Desulfocapsa sp.]
MAISKPNINKKKFHYKQANLTLAEYDFLLSHNPNAIIITDCEGHIEYVNAVFTSSTGYTEEDVFCRHYKELNLYQSPGIPEENWQAVLDGGVWEGEVVSIKKNGEKINEEIFLMPILKTKDEAYAVAFINRDISARKKIEHELLDLTNTLEQRVLDRTSQLNKTNIQLLNTLDHLQKTQDQLIESEKMASLGNLVGGIAHEINTPIGIAYTASTHLEKDTRTLKPLYQQGKMTRTDLEEYLTTALEATSLLNSNLNRASDLIRSFKQVAIDQSVEVKRRFHLHKYLEEVLLSLRPMLKKTLIKTRIKCPRKLRLNSYPGAFSQIITNLISNSVTHAYAEGDQGYIDIEASQKGNNLILTFQDDGAGMDNHTIEHVFTPFFTTNRENGGSGLGLHIVYNLVTQKLNGTIYCTSQPGEGTTFNMQIPLPHH